LSDEQKVEYEKIYR
jgi:hypothetical protein